MTLLSGPAALASPFVRGLHAVLLGVAAATFGADLALPAGVAAAAVGAFSGSLLAERLFVARWRMLAMLGLASLLFLLGLGGAGLVARSEGFAAAVSVSTAMSVAERTVSGWRRR